MSKKPDRHEVSQDEMIEALPNAYMLISGRILKSGHVPSTAAWRRSMRLIGSIEWEGHAEVEVRTSYWGLIVWWRKDNRELELCVSWTKVSHKTVQRMNGKAIPDSLEYVPSAQRMRGLMKWLDPEFTERSEPEEEGGES